MNFVTYDIISLIVIIIAVTIFLYTHRKNISREGLLYLYRTKVGIKFIDKMGSKYKKILKSVQYVSIGCGYILMILAVYLIAKISYLYLKSSELAKAIKAPPLIPLVPYVDKVFTQGLLPPLYFTYWVIIIALIAIPHEFAHGIFSKINNIRIKSTGFGFLGPFLAAFVEPDEKEMNKSSKKAQLAILSAGTFSNLIFAAIFGLIMILFFKIAFIPSGIIFNAYATDNIKLEDIRLNNLTINEINLENLNESNIRIMANEKEYYANLKVLKKAIEEKEEEVIVIDSPAFKYGIKGPIIEINGNKITSIEELKTELTKYSPNEEISIKTIDEKGNIIEEKVKLGERNGKAFLGIGFYEAENRGIVGTFGKVISKIKKPYTYYSSIIGDLGIFINDLFWWIFIVSFSVALMNMLPVGIFDGGRFFYLTIVAITRSEKIAKKAFKISSLIFIMLAAVIMIKWVFVFF